MAIIIERLNDNEVATTRPPGYYSKRDKIRHLTTRRERDNSRHPGKNKQGTLCLDGEGYDKDGVHLYTYIAASNSDGSVVQERYNPDGLSTEECFFFLCHLPSNRLKVGFSFGYDINMMLRDVDVLALWKLHDKGYVRWKGWTINWTPNKVFSIKRPSKKGSKDLPISCTVWDMFGYFQKSFVKTIWEWQVGTDEELREVARMKEQRSVFDPNEQESIAHYCKLECKLGAQVFDKLIACTKDVGLKLTRYDGAGSVAAAMLRKHSVQAYMQPKLRLPDEVILSGYYGGRFDLSAYGECGDAIQYDINSAYPYQALSLPCLSCGHWEYRPTWDESATWAIWNTSWSIDPDHLWTPFPYRSGQHIKYLRDGQGWYWANEVREAARLYPASVRSTEGYVYVQACDHRPFSFIQDYYDRRRELKEQGDLAQMVLKLGLNSIYGKLAQNVGRSIPKTQCFIWAGIITSNTRAMLLARLRESPSDCLLLATDACVFRNSVSHDYGGSLGEWERTYLQHLFIITNGVYTATGTKEVKNATRGVSIKDMYDPTSGINHWNAIRLMARRKPSFTYPLSTRRFHGLGRGLSENPVLSTWRTWALDRHDINYGRFPDKEVRDGRLYPTANPTPLLMSTPFDPKVFRQDDVPIVDILEALERPLN